MTLEKFKKYLISLIDACEMDEFFKAVENCPYDYDKPTYNASKGQYLAYPAFMNPCGVFGEKATLVKVLAHHCQRSFLRWQRSKTLTSVKKNIFGSGFYIQRQ